MFATCLFCNSALGSNEAIEHFPVGKRLAYDAAKGRLWVVCPKCERWNLSPLEERWEAIEEAERAYADTKKRVATENIGLARLPDGTELVRIGAPLRPEFAAWRYGDQFGRRRRRQLYLGGGIVAAAAGVVIAGPVMGLAFGGGGSALLNSFNVGNAFYQKFVPRVRVTDSTGQVLSLAALDVKKVKMELRGDDQSLHVEFPYREWMPTGPLLASLGVTKRPSAKTSCYAELDGDIAARAMASILPVLNGSGGSAADVERAVKLVEDNPSGNSFVRQASSVDALVRQASAAAPGFWSTGIGKRDRTARHIPKTLRLALEMALHEDDERRALNGELAELERRWKDAEEIAGIADSLTLPENVEERMNELRSPKE
jgi:hypothetical protein